MQAPKHTSYCSATIRSIRSEMVFRHSFPGNFPSDKEQIQKEQIQKPQVEVEKLKRHPSNSSLSSHDSGVGFTKADYEIQRAIKAQRVQRPHIIVLHKGKPVSNTNNKYDDNKNNDLYNHDEFEANIVVAAATASKRNRREIAVVQKRQTMISIGNNPLSRQLSLIKNNSAPNLPITTQIVQVRDLKEINLKENKENIDVKDQVLKKSSSKHKLFKSVSLSIKKFVGTNKEKKRRSRLIQQIHEQPKFF